MKSIRLALAALVIAAGCQGTIGGDDGESVGRGGVPGDPTAHPEAVVVDMYSHGAPSAACTGALIAPRVVVTAAHCAVGSEGARVTAPVAKGQTTSVSSVLTYDWVMTDSDHTGDHDVALLVLRDPIIVNDYATVDREACPGCSVDAVNRLHGEIAVTSAMRTSKTAPKDRPYDWFIPYAGSDAGGPVMQAGTRSIVGIQIGHGVNTGGGYVLRLDDYRVRQWISFVVESESKKHAKAKGERWVSPPLSGIHFGGHTPGPPPDDSSADSGDSSTTDGSTTDGSTSDSSTSDSSSDSSTSDSSTDSTSDSSTDSTSEASTGSEGDSTGTGDTGAGGDSSSSSTGDETGAGGGDPNSNPPPDGEPVDPGGQPDPDSQQNGENAPQGYDPRSIDILNPNMEDLAVTRTENYWGTSTTSNDDPEQREKDEALVEQEKANAEQMQGEAYVVGTHGYPGQMEAYPDEEAQMAMQDAAAQGQTIVMSVCYGGLATETNDSSASTMADDLGIPKDQIVGCTGNVEPNDGSFDCDGQWVDGNGNPPSKTDYNGVQLRNCSKDINGDLQC